MILDESKPEKIPGHSWLSFFTGSALLYHICIGHFPTDLCIFLSGCVSAYFYALLYWEFSHRFTPNLVAFCPEIILYAFVKILAGSLFFPCWSLFSFPCLSTNLSRSSVKGKISPHLLKLYFSTSQYGNALEKPENHCWNYKTIIPQNARLTALTKDQGESSGLKKTAVKPRRGGRGGGFFLEHCN